MSLTDFFHGITVSLVETGARTIALPSSSIIGLVDTFTPGLGLAASNVPILLTRESEALAAFGADSALTRACKVIFNQSAAAIVAVGVPADTEAAVLTSAVIGGVSADGTRTGLQALLDGKSLFNLQPRLVIAPKHSATEAVAAAMDVLRTSDKPGMESDEFELRIDDRDSAVTLPSRGASIEIYLGYAGSTLSREGRYVVDEVEVSGPPDTLVIRGKASDMRGSGKTTRSGSWEGVSLATIVSAVARRNGWEPACTVATIVPRADQLGESDFNFITRLARQHDCTAKVADGKLIVMPRQGGVTASGKTLGVVTINKTDVSRYSFRLGDRSTHKAVSTKYQDKATGKLAVVNLNNDDAPDGLPPVHTDRHIHPNKTAAEQAAKARLAAFNRSTAGVRLEMPGRSDLFAERMINAQGFKDGLDGEYLVDSREQVFTQSGWSTTIECNAGKKGKAKAKGKKPGKTLKIVQL